MFCWYLGISGGFSGLYCCVHISDRCVRGSASVTSSRGESQRQHTGSDSLIGLVLRATVRLSQNYPAYPRNCLQWGRSNLVDPAEWPEIVLLNRDFGSILSIFLRRKKKGNTEFTKFSLVRTPKFTKSDFSGLAPMRGVLISRDMGFWVSERFRVARLQKEVGPQKCLIQCKNTTKIATKDPKNDLKRLRKK